MSRFKISIVTLGPTIGILAATSAGAWERGPVDVLAVLPDVTQNVQSSAEGLTVGPDGNIYVTTFGFNTHGALTGNSVLIVISPSGNIVRKVDIQGSSPHTLGLAFNPVFGNLLVLDFGAGTVLDVNPHSGLSTVKAGPFANSGLNALTFDWPATPMCRIHSTASFGRCRIPGRQRHGPAIRCSRREPD